jgi:hypothetical protein
MLFPFQMLSDGWSCHAAPMRSAVDGTFRLHNNYAVWYYSDTARGGISI